MRESRLKFTDKERLDPAMGKAVQKAEKASDKAEKAQAKIPTKKVVKPELITDNSNGKIKVKLHFEDICLQLLTTKSEVYLIPEPIVLRMSLLFCVSAVPPHIGSSKRDISKRYELVTPYEFPENLLTNG